MTRVTRSVSFLSFMILGIAASAAFGEAQSIQGQLPEAATVLERAKALQVPSVGYQVTVSQTVEQASSESVLKAGSVNSMVVVFTPGEGLKRARRGDEQQAESAQAASVLVEVGPFIEEMLSYPTTTIETAELKGRPHYRIQGHNAQNLRGCTMWIDIETGSVSQIHVYLFEQLFAEVQISYTDKNREYWLPSRVSVIHASDSSWVDLAFSGYSFLD